MKPFLCAAAVLCASAVAGCGKKGPPLAPYVRIPAAIEQITARRVGEEVYVSVTVPAKNVDASIPVAISRVEIYGYTGRTAPSRLKWVELGKLVATVPITPPAAAAGTSDAGAHPPDEPVPVEDAVSVRSGSVVEPVVSDAAPSGTIVTVLDALKPDDLIQGPVAAVPPLRGANKGMLAAAALPTTPAPLRRFYMALAFSPNSRPGPPGALVEVPLTPLPDPPSDLHASYTETALTLQWEPSGGLLGYIMDKELGPEPPPLDEYDDRPVVAIEKPDALPPGPTAYNVYRLSEPDPLAPLPPLPTSSFNAPAPAPLNAAPLAAFTVSDTVQFDRHVCYTVRAVRGTPPHSVESPPSNQLCVTPVDVFPPAPPRSLAAVPSKGAINLIWEPNDETDVGGYLVLRGEGANATLQTLTPSPIVEARYRDDHVKPGVKYVYAVVAVDSRLPVPNASGPSNRVEEMAR